MSFYCCGKDHDQKAAWGEKGLFYLPLCSPIIIQGIQGINWRTHDGGVLFIGSSSMAYSHCLLPRMFTFKDMSYFINLSLSTSIWAGVCQSTGTGKGYFSAVLFTVASLPSTGFSSFHLRFFFEMNSVPLMLSPLLSCSDRHK